MEEVIYRHQDQTWHLSAHRAIFWQEEQALIVSDLHLGKSAHFRKAGIAVPANIGQDDLYRLQLLITAYNPSQIIIVGDMFHSRENNDVPYFKLWRQQFAHIRFKLVKGNHDILPAATYEALNLEVFDTLTIRDIHFIHEPCCCRRRKTTITPALFLLRKTLQYFARFRAFYGPRYAGAGC